MKRLLAVSLLAGLLAPTTAKAVTPGSTYDFCGGSGFTFCASVTMSVAANVTGGYMVTLDVLNRSVGVGGSAPAQFVSVGLDNVLPAGERLAAPTGFKIQQGTWNGSGYTFADVCGAAPTCWNMATNTTEAGGVNVDFDGNTTQGNQVSIASNCLATEAHWNVAPINSCGRGTNAALWRPVRISFNVTQNITSADLYIKAIANGSTECQTGVNQIACTTVQVNTTPEPATMTLVAGGLLALGLVRRRRRDGDDLPPAA